MARIVVVAPTRVPSRRANSLQVMKMTQALTSIGQEVALLAPEVSTEGDMPEAARDWDSLSRHYGLQVCFPIEWITANPALRKYDYGWQAVNRALALKADYFYTRLPQAAALASWRGIRTIFEVHDMPQGSVGPLLFRRMLRSRRIERMVLISAALRDDLSHRFEVEMRPPRTIVAPDGVDLGRYRELPEPQTARQTLNRKHGLSLPESAFTAGYSGHLYAGRGAELLLDLAGKLSRVSFLIAGGEPEAVERLRAEAQARNLSNVHLTGFIPNADLPGYQAACDFLLMPYQHRVAASSGGDIARYLSPMKLFEYLACGRVILSSDLPVLREVLSPENAVLLPPDDLAAWCAAITHLCSQPEARAGLSMQARQTAQAYSWEARAERLLSGLEEAE